MSSVIFLEKPEAILPVMKVMMQTHSIAFLPNISDNLPYNGWKTVDMRKFEAGTKYATEPDYAVSP